MKPVQLNKKGTILKRIWIMIGLILVFVVSLQQLNLDLTKTIERLGNTGTVVGRLMVIDISLMPSIFTELFVSMSLAFLALVIGAVIALILALMASSNTTFSPVLGASIKAIITVVRAVPSLVWVLMVVASIGFGNTGGVIGLVIPTVGFLTKSFTQSIEEEGHDLMEAMKAAGLPWVIMMTKGILIQVLPKLISWISLRLEANIAESISLGIVGVTGIGLLIAKAVTTYNYPMISTTILVIFMVMFALEISIHRIRQSLLTN